MTPRRRKCKKRITEHHAAIRAIARTGRPFWRLREEVEAGRFERLRSQSHTRTLCRTDIDGETVYFVLNKKRLSIITVLSADMAMSQLQGALHGED
jgi:hypothetical protein